MAKYNVGDKVLIRDDLNVGGIYGDDSFEKDMINFRGKIVEIKEVNSGKYIIKGNTYNWTDEMIERLVNATKEIEIKEIKKEEVEGDVNMIKEIKVGMKLVLKEELDAGLKVYPKGTGAKVVDYKEESKRVHIKVQGDLGVFKFEEVQEYFKEYVEPKVEATKVYDPEIGEDDIKRIIQSDNAIIVFLNSGTKGVAKCSEDDEFDFEIGRRVAYLKAKIKDLEKELKTY